MGLEVTDAASHRQNKIANAARVIGRSERRQKVFDAICTGKKMVKTVAHIRRATGMNYMQIRQAAVVLADEHLVGTEKVNGELAYRRDKFYSKNKAAILRLARSGKKKLDAFPTSYTPKMSTLSQQAVHIRLPSRWVRANRVTIDDIDSFARVRAIQNAGNGAPHSEAGFKRGLKAVLGESGRFVDWGGETDDLFTTRLKIRGKRYAAAFGLKGKGTKGKLTPKKMGKNGDQIPRLFQSPADVFIVQYWGEVDSSVHGLLQQLAIAKSVSGRPVFFGVIDGADSARLMAAYQRHFRRR